MKPKQQLIDEGLINDRLQYSRLYIAKIYKTQLDKFYKLGIGKETNNGVMVTQSLIDITKKRLYDLCPTFDYSHPHIITKGGSRGNKK